MTEQELIKKLTRLKEVKPNQDWVIFCRQNLTREIKGETSHEPNFNLVRFLVSLEELMFSRAILKPAIVFGVIFGLIFSSGIMALAKARQSLPGDRLYPVKIALEQAQLLATPSATAKAELQSEIITLRLQELNKILENENQESTEVKQQKMEEAVINLQRQLLSARDELPKLEKTGSKRIAEVAKGIDAKALQAEQTLSQAKAGLPPEAKQTLTDKIAEAVEAADKVSTKALGVMVEMQEGGEGTISEQEIIEKLNNKIQKITQKIGAIQESLNNLAIGNQFPIDAPLINDLLKKAEEILGQARASLDNKEIPIVLQRITAAAELVKNAENLIKDIILPQPVEPTAPSQSSSPPAILPTATTTSSILETTPETLLPPATPLVQGANISAE